MRDSFRKAIGMVLTCVLTAAVVCPPLCPVKAASEDDFAVVRQRIRDHLLDERFADADAENQKMYADKVASAVKSAQEFMESMNKSAERTSLWEDKTDLSTNLSRLNTMAKAYAMKDSPLKGNKGLLDTIVSGCEFVYLNQYNEQTAETGNWWNWEVGYAKSAVSIVALAYDGLTPQQVERYLRGVKRFCPDPYKQQGTLTSTGANRVDICYSILIQSICEQDVPRVKETCTALLDVFKFVQSGDGFYEDGSFLQHGTTAYNFSYGDVLLDGLSLIMSFIADTQWEMTDPLAENLYIWVYDAYEPLLYKGAAMDMVRGRAVSRDYDGHQNGHSVLTSIMRVAEFAPEQYQNDLKAMVKYHLTADTARDFLKSTGNITNLTLAKRILNDSSIEPKPPLVDNHVYNSMDRVTHQRESYGAGLAMNSSRISRYESINSENLHGWYTGDGTLYLYNNDLSQFDYHYFYTVDPYRYPGTTVDKQTRANSSAANQEGRTNQDWVGSANIDNLYSVSGMSLKGFNSTLTAKKGWFMFDDEIVCLGAGITSTDSVPVETIVENRKLTEDGGNEVTINGGGAQLEDFEQEMSFDNVNWMHLEGNVEGTDIGYYFPQAVTINAVRQARTHNIQENNTTRTSRESTRNYFTGWISHGSNPKKQTYAYVLLPGMSAQEVGAYAEQPAITILENSEDIQAVRHETLGVTGINFWQEREKSIAGVTSSTQAAVIVKQDDSAMELSVCDPTQKNADGITLTVEGEGYSVLSADEGVSVSAGEKSVRIDVNTKDAKGKQFRVKLVKMNDIPSEEVLATRIGNAVVMIAGSSKALVNGEKKEIDGCAPFIEDGRAYAPVRFLAESLGGQVEWDQDTATATVTYLGAKIVMQEGAFEMLVNDKPVRTEAAVLTRDGRMMAPVRVFAEHLGKQVYWNSKGLLVIGNNERLFNAATESVIIDDLIQQIYQ